MQFIILSQDFITAKEKRGRMRESAEYLNKAGHHDSLMWQSSNLHLHHLKI